MTSSAAVIGKSKRIFHTLDGLRGVAAITVVFYHLKRYIGPFQCPSAYLAVDLFFMMSGVVIAHGYEAKLRHGMTVGRFLAIRMTRLYPVYLFGLLGAIVLSLIARARHPQDWPWAEPQFAGMAVLNLFMLPSPSRGGEVDELFPLNIVCWSLFWEMVINILYAASARALTDRRLGWVAAASGGLLVTLAVSLGSVNGGAYWGDVQGGPVRITFSFMVGVLLHRWHAAGWKLPFKLPAPILLAVTLILLTVDVSGNSRILFDLMVVIIVFPTIISAALANEPTVATSAYTWLGLVSYPLYVVHLQILLILNSLLLALHIDPGPHAPYSGLLFALVAIAAAWLIAVRYEFGARRRLGRLIARHA